MCLRSHYERVELRPELPVPNTSRWTSSRGRIGFAPMREKCVPTPSLTIRPATSYSPTPGTRGLGGFGLRPNVQAGESLPTAIVVGRARELHTLCVLGTASTAQNTDHELLPARWTPRIVVLGYDQQRLDGLSSRRGLANEILDRSSSYIEKELRRDDEAVGLIGETAGNFCRTATTGSQLLNRLLVSLPHTPHHAFHSM